jgi:hypothetical protein
VSKRLIKKLIETYVNEAFDSLLLNEQEEELDLSGADDAGDAADDLGDLDIGGGSGGEEGGELDLGGGEEGDLDADEGEEDLEGDMGDDFSGGAGGGFSGGGDFGGDDGDFGDEEDTDEEEGDSVPDQIEISDDPVQAATDIAINMLEETGDDNVILSAVKASIQKNFENFNDAVPIVKSLWDTEHPILKVVARKLLLFIQGR